MSLQVWLPLNGNLDNQGLTPVTVTNSSTTIDNSGKIGKCYKFSGSSQKISATLPSTVSSAVGSLACWVKFTALPSSSGWAALMQLGAAGGFANCRLGLYCEYGTGINVSINGSSAGRNYKAYSFSTEVWYHICTTYDGTNVKIYINGTEQLNKAATTGSYTTVVNTLFMGGTNNFYLNGYMNDCRYYDHALSAQEVKKLARGLILHYPLNNNGFGQENLFSLDTVISNSTKTIVTIVNNVINVKSSQISYGAFSQSSNSRITFEAGTTYMLSGHIKSITKGEDNFIPRLTIRDSSNTIKVSAVASGNESNVFKTYTPTETFSGYISGFVTFSSGSSNTTIAEAEFSNVKLEKGSIATGWSPAPSDSIYPASYLTTVYDISGYKNHGTIVGSLTAAAGSPRYKTCIVNNDTSYITCPQLFGEVQTISFWLKSDKSNGCFIIEPNSKLGFCISNNLLIISKWSQLTYKATSFISNEWNHIVIIKTGESIASLYINGVEITERGSNNTYIAHNVSVPWLFWRSYNENYYGVGSMSDVRIYATALSADDVAELYALGQV